MPTPYKLAKSTKESLFKKLNKTIIERRVNINITSLQEQTHTAMETLKSQKQPLTNLKDVEELLELLNREGSSIEGKKDDSKRNQPSSKIVNSSQQ